MTSEPTSHVPAADRTLNLLEALAEAPDGLAGSELVSRLDISRSGLYALLSTLRLRGYVTQDDNRGNYRLGPALWRLVPGRSENIASLVDTFAGELSHDPLPETVALVRSDGNGTVVIASVQGAATVRTVYPTGTLRSPDTADALVLRAGDGHDEPAVLDVRRNGHAVRRSSDVVEIACPVCIDGVRPDAALLAGLPVQRSGTEHVDAVIDQLRRTAARLSHRLGATVYQPYGWATGDLLGPSRELDTSEIDEFLEGLWGAQLACVRDNGSPHVVPLWYEWDGAAMWLAASPGASWRNYVEEGGHVSLTLDEPWPPLRRVFIDGLGERVPDDAVPGGLDGLRRRLAERYLGQGAGDRNEFREIDGWSAFRIVPERMHGKQGLGVAAS